VAVTLGWSLYCIGGRYLRVVIVLVKGSNISGLFHTKTSYMQCLETDCRNKSKHMS